MKIKKDYFLEDEVAHVDRLGYQPYVNAISSAILNDEIKTPFVFGIYGQWGSGKSTLMNLVKEKIEKTEKQTIFCVWFAPWQYQGQPNMLVPLFLSLLEQAKNSKGLKNRFAGINKKFAKLLNISAETLLDLIARPLVDINRIRERGEKYEEEYDITKSLNFKDVIFLSTLKKEFEQLVSYLVSDNGKLVVFIDDLDRCLPEKVIEMLESIKLFIGVKRCVFIIGMNYDIVSLCIKYKFKDYSSKPGGFKDSDVEEYFEKIIQLPFRIPALQIKHLEKFITEVEKDPDIISLKDLFAKFLPKNPRKVKKVLNVFRLTRKLAKYSGLLSSSTKKSTIVLELLAKIIVIRERWLALYTQYENNTDLLKSHEKDPDNIVNKLLGLKNREDLVQIFKFGSHKFENQKNLQQYFTLSEITIALERKPEREIVSSEGEVIPSDSGLKSEKQETKSKN